MNVYRLRSDYRYRTFLPDEDADILSIYDMFNGTSIEAWQPLRVGLYAEDPAQLPAAPVSLLATHIPLFNKFAAEALHAQLMMSGEFLPLECDYFECFAYNVTSLIDALDTNASSITYSSSSTKITNVERYVLHDDRIKDAVIFKLPPMPLPLSDVFVTDRFVDLYDDSNLSGLVFDPLF